MAFAALVIALVFMAVVIALVIFYGERDRGFDGLNPEQSREREENLARSLSLARSRGEITNNDIENLLGVSNATAERYLNELESRGHLVQIGKTGKAVRYKVN